MIFSVQRFFEPIAKSEHLLQNPLTNTAERLTLVIYQEEVSTAVAYGVTKRLHGLFFNKAGEEIPKKKWTAEMKMQFRERKSSVTLKPVSTKILWRGWLMIIIGIVALGGLGYSLYGIVREPQDEPLQHIEQVSTASTDQIKINQLAETLEQLAHGKTEQEFIGITSNGTDCIYIVKNGIDFNIEFEAMTQAQYPYLEKIRQFAETNGFQAIRTTYGNKPHYNMVEAPVIRIVSVTNLNNTVDLAEKIQKEIFSNDKQTLYDVVP